MSNDAEIGGAIAGGFGIGGFLFAILTFNIMAIEPVKILAEPTAQVTECHAREWPSCIAKACPNGIITNGSDVVSCKPASAPCPFPRDAGAAE